MLRNVSFDRAVVARLNDLSLELVGKGTPLAGSGVVGDLVGLAVSELSTPTMVLLHDALDHNVALMASYCEGKGAWLAPHAKTTMAPAILQRQAEAGAWAMTVATVSQAAALRRFGVDRLLIANEVIDPVAVRWLANELEAHPDLEVYCLVDSVESLRRLDRVPPGRLGILVELGHAHGRTGARSIAEAADLADAISRSKHRLAGVEGYEGLLVASGGNQVADLVDDYLAELDLLTERVAPLVKDEPCLVSAGGSALFDRVVDILGGRPGIQLVLRSGCYVTHDSGWYETISPLGARHTGEDRLLNAIEVHATVSSRPEPTFAVADAGKRDLGYDLGLPVVLGALVPDAADGRRRIVEPNPIVAALSDQHAHLQNASALFVGDRIAFGVSHPCATFDRWRLIPVIDRSDHVIEVAVTLF